MKKLLKLLILVCFVVFAGASVQAQKKTSMKKLAQTGLQFLKVDMSARAAAMGGAYLVAGEDANSMLYNPAGIGRMAEGFDFYAGQMQWIADITYSTVGLAKNFGELGSIGINAIYCDYGEIIGTRVDAGNADGFIKTGALDVGAYALGLTYARKLSDKFTIGGQLKWVSQTLGSSILNDGSDVKNQVSDLAYDFGTIFYPGFKSFRFGMSIRNFSRELKYQEENFQLPLTFTIGAAMNVMDFMDMEDQTLLVSIDAIHPRDYSERLHFGAEYWVLGMAAVRVGYKHNYDEEGLTAGLGFCQSLAGFDLKIDYAYAPMDIFDSVNRFTIGLGF